MMAMHPDAFQSGYFEMIYPTAVVVGLSYPIVGGVVVHKQRANIGGWMLIVGGMTVAISQGTIGYVIFSYHSLAEPFPGTDLISWIGVWLWSVSLSVIPVSLLYFPNNRPISRAWNWVLVLIALSLLDPLARAIYSWDIRGLTLVNEEGRVLMDQLDGRLGTLQTIGQLSFMVASLLAGVSIAIRYRQADVISRLQIKWVAFGFSIFALTTILWVLLSETPSSPWSSTRDIFLQSITVVAAFITIIAIGIAILRYRLYDIDLIIRRTTSYAILTALLVLLYFGSIVALQRLLTPFTGESDVAVVLSTLLIAVLFLPLRRRVQGSIDRRFFRRKYDAEKTLAAFATTVRNETDLDALTAELIRVIQETMEPESVSVWLNPKHERHLPNENPASTPSNRKAV